MYSGKVRLQRSGAKRVPSVLPCDIPPFPFPFLSFPLASFHPASAEEGAVRGGLGRGGVRIGGGSLDSRRAASLQGELGTGTAGSRGCVRDE